MGPIPHAFPPGPVKAIVMGCSFALCWTAVFATAAERSIDEIADIYREAAALAAGTEHVRLRDTVCPASPRVPPVDREQGSLPQGEPAPRIVPPLADWYREPVKVFDELYFVGTNEHSSWAVVTDEGIMLLDTVYDYATGEAIVGGLRKLGFDPADIELVIISHGHGDHHAGAKYLTMASNMSRPSGVALPLQTERRPTTCSSTSILPCASAISYRPLAPTSCWPTT